MLDARRLEIYCVVAEEGSFTAAAAKLHLSQSAVSQQIAILERDIGAPLMDRMARGIRLTPVGKLLAERAQILLHDMSGLEQEMRRVVNPPKKVRLGVFATAGAHLVPVVVQRYRQRYKDTRLELHASHPENLSAELASGVIDVGLTWDYDFMARPADALVHRHLLEDRMCLILPCDHPLAGAGEPLRLIDAANEAWVVREHSSPLYQNAFEIMCRAAGFEPTIVFRTEDYQSTQGLVAANIGVAAVPRLSLIAQRPDIVMHPIEGPSFARRIDAVTLPERKDTPLVRQLMNLLGEIWTSKN